MAIRIVYRITACNTRKLWIATIDGRLNDVEDPSICRASSGACSIVCEAAQRDREASLDRLRSAHAGWR